MTNQFIRSISNAIAYRRVSKIPKVGNLVVGFSIFLVGYVVLALMIAPEDRLEYHFVKESGIVTALSGVMLGMASGFSGLAFFLSEKQSNIHRFFWLFCSMGFLFFALDELLEFHEDIGRLARHEFGSTKSFRNWNDIIVIAYGVIAIPVILVFIPEILRYPKVAETMMAAFSFYCVHTIIDSISERRTTLSGITEESAKLFSSGFFALCMFIAVLGIMSSTRNSMTK